MDNWKFAIAIFGWIFAYYLHTRSITRTEISRNKDQVVKSLRDLPDWASKLLKDHAPNELQLENYISSQASNIEFQANNLNRLACCIILEPAKIATLRNIDCTVASKDTLQFNYTIFQTCNDLIGIIEENYSAQLFHDNMLKRLYRKRKPELLGVTCSASMMSFFFMLFQMFK